MFKKTTINELDSDLEIVNAAKDCALAAMDKKASDILILNVSELTSYTDYFVICSADSERQVLAIVNNVQDEMIKKGKKASSLEGLASSSWVLLDFGSIIFHCFTQSAREYYDLEGLWIDSKKVDFE